MTSGHQSFSPGSSAVHVEMRSVTGSPSAGSATDAHPVVNATAAAAATTPSCFLNTIYSFVCDVIAGRGGSRRRSDYVLEHPGTTAAVERLFGFRQSESGCDEGLDLYAPRTQKFDSQREAVRVAEHS